MFASLFEKSSSHLGFPAKRENRFTKKISHFLRNFIFAVSNLIAFRSLAKNAIIFRFFCEKIYMQKFREKIENFAKKQMRKFREKTDAKAFGKTKCENFAKNYEEKLLMIK